MLVNLVTSAWLGTADQQGQLIPSADHPAVCVISSAPALMYCSFVSHCGSLVNSFGVLRGFKSLIWPTTRSEKIAVHFDPQWMEGSFTGCRQLNQAGR